MRIIVTLLFLLSIFCLNSTKVLAAGPYYWIGGADTSVNVAASWSLASNGVTANHIPVAGETAIFDSGGNRNAKIDGAFSVATIFIDSSYTQTITQSAGVTVTIGTSYSQAGGIYTATTGTLTDNGSFAISGGTFTPPSTSFAISGNLTVSGTGSINMTSKTVTFNSNVNLASTITVPGALGGTVIISKGGTAGAVTVASGTSINLGDNPTTVTPIANSITNNGTIIINSGTWTTSNGSIVNNGLITHNGNGWAIAGNLTNNPGATITYASTTLSISGDFTQNGTFNLTGKTVVFNSTINIVSTVTAPGVLGGTVSILKGGTAGTFTVASGTSVNLGDNPTSSLYPTLNIINNGTIVINSGTWTVNNSITNNGTITHNGNGWTILTSLTNNTGATITYSGTAFTINNGDFTQLGTFNLTGKTVTFSSLSTVYNTTVTANGALGGTVVVNTPGNFIVAIGTSINLGDSPTTYIGLGKTLTNNGTIVINSGTWGFYSGGYSSPVGATLVNNGTITHNGSGWSFTSSNASASNFINNAGATTTYAGTTMTISFTGSFTNSGTFAASSMTSLSVTGNLTNTGIMTTGVVAVTIAGNLTQTGAGTSTFATTTFGGTGNQIVTTNGAFGGITVIAQPTGSYSSSFTVATGTIINLGNNATTSVNTTTNYGGAFTNNGTILLGTGVWNYVGDSRNLTNNGTITSSNSNWIFTGGGLINNAGATITYPGSTLNFNGDFTQKGTFDLSGKTITFNGGGVDSTITSNGVLGGTVVINKSTSNGSSVTVATGTSIYLGNDPTITINAVNGYYRKITNNGTINIGTGTFTISGLVGPLINNGTIVSSSTAWVFNLSSFNNSITGVVNAPLLSTISIGSDLTQLGTFDMTGKIITYITSGISPVTITSNGALGGTVVFNETGGGSSIIIATGTSIYLGNNATTTIDTAGNYFRTLTNNGTINIGTGTWTVGDVNANIFTNNGTINSSSTAWVTNGTGFTNSATGIVNAPNLVNFTIGSSQNGGLINAGTFDFTGKIITFTNNGFDIPFTTPTFGGSFVLNTGTHTVTITNSMTVINATTTSGILANPTSPLNLTVTGDLSITDASKFGGPNLTVKMSNGNDQNLTVTTGSMTTPLQINKSVGYKTILQSNYTGSGAAATVTVNSGALYLNGKTLSATTTVNNGGELQVQGGSTFTTPTLASGSTVTYVGNGDGLPNTYYVNPLLSYSNLKINSTDANDTFAFGLPTTNLLGYWKGDSNALDSSGNGYNATLVNGATATGTGKFNNTFFFDGVNDRVDTPVLASSTAGTQCAWINETSNPSGLARIMESGATGIGGILYLNGSKLSYAIGSATLISTSSIPTGTWTHVCVVMSTGNPGQLYINGQPDGNPAVLTGSIGGYALNIGDASGGARTFSGSIDDVRFYTRALTQPEILALYNYTGVDSTTTSLTLPGSLTVSSGILSAASTTLIMSGTNQTITLAGTTTIASLTAGSTTVPTTLTFGTSGNLIITTTTTLQGTSSLPLTLRSTTPGNQWHFQPDGARTFGYLDVADSYNTSSTTINAQSYPGLVDSHNNTNWTFTIPLLTLSTQGRQLATTSATTVNQDLGGAFTLTPTGGNFTLNSLKLKQVGSFATSTITNLKLYSEAATTCRATKPVGTTLYGPFTPFDSTNQATTTGTLTLSTTTCLYLTYDLVGTPGPTTMGRTLDFEITNPGTDLLVTGGTVTPGTSVNIPGVTMIPADNTAVIQSPPPITTTNPNCSDNQIKSLLSLRTDTPSTDPTLYYLKNCAVWQQTGNSTPRRLTNANFQVHALTFEDLSGPTQTGGSVRMSITLANMDPGQENTFMNVTRTMSTTVNVGRGW